MDAEKAALFSGDLDAIAKMAEQKMQLTQKLEGASATDLSALSRRLHDHTRLLEAAKSGVGQAVATLTKQRAARSSLSSYDPSGNATSIGTPLRKTDRKF
ncbi:hypothetical protein [Pseudooctadecabacter jejudonensis]|uniref:hypothetical protein n=1 Tax=Pseudooctadecabacter jejudonensis TaxID=1391910 RepID=UPI001F333710|nr:hypothetical protein [Pseudooctadecabacter jejudonensis]